MESGDGSEVAAQLEALVERVRAIPDAEERMKVAHALVKSAGDALVDASDLRHLAAVELRAEQPGAWPYRVIAEVLGLHHGHGKQDAQAIVKGRPAKRAANRPG